MSKFKKIKRYFYQKSILITKNNEGFGLNEFLGIAAALIVAALVVIPGLKAFGKSILDGLETWWGNISPHIFQTQIVP